MIRRRMMQKEIKKWELIEERIINNGDDKILFDGASLQDYTELRIVIDAETETCSLWIFANGAYSTAYAIGRLKYAATGRRTMEWHLKENAEGTLSATWTGSVNGIKESGSITDALKRSLPVTEVLVQTLGGNMKSGTITLYGMR